MKALWMQMIDLYLVFLFVEGRCHGNQLILGKWSLAFFALSFENELQCNYLNVRVNSGDDVAISCKNLVNFCWVTPAIMELIWERQVQHGQKQAYFVEYLRTYWTDFRNIFTIWKRFTCRWCSCTLFSNFQGTLPWQPNNVAIMKANWYYVSSELGYDTPHATIHRTARYTVLHDTPYYLIHRHRPIVDT